MKKSIIKYVISNIKNNAKFEERLIDVINTGLGDEAAVDALINGVITDYDIVDMDGLINYLNSQIRGKVKVIIETTITNECNFKVEYVRIVRKYFADNEEANSAIANCNYSAGKSSPQGEYTIAADIEDKYNSATLDFDDISDFVKVIRKS